MLFKSTTRRTKGEILSTSPYQGFIHEAQPLASFVEATADDAAYWTVHLPTPNGAALAYGVSRGPYDSEAEAIASGLRSMKSDGWRATREEAEADMAVEITHRTNFRADGKPRGEV